MLKLNRKFFYDNFPWRPISQPRVDALNFILGKLDESKLIDDPRQYAYVLATIKHETADTYNPVIEYGSEKYLKSKPYYPYMGRGYVQLTWKENYVRFSNLLDIDLVTHPELLLKTDISWRVAELGMARGLFTGKRLTNYFYDETTDWVNARRIINVLDKAELIADYAKKFFNIIKP